MDHRSDNLSYLSSLISANLDPNVKLVLFKHHTISAEYREQENLLASQIPTESSLE